MACSFTVPPKQNQASQQVTYKSITLNVSTKLCSSNLVEQFVTPTERKRESPHLMREYIVEVYLSQTNSLQFYTSQECVGREWDHGILSFVGEILGSSPDLTFSEGGTQYNTHKCWQLFWLNLSQSQILILTFLKSLDAGV